METENQNQNATSEKKRAREFLLTFVGLLYIAIGIISYYIGIIDIGISGIFWFSYTAFFLIGLGILFRKSYLIASQLAIVFIPYLIWSIDFFYVLITGIRLFGITDYIFWPGPVVPKLITLQHLFTIPFALLAIHSIKLKRGTFWILSLAEIAFFFVVVKFLTFPGKNVNCVFQNCLPFSFDFLPYSAAWFLMFGTMIIISAIIINLAFFREEKIVNANNQNLDDANSIADVNPIKQSVDVNNDFNSNNSNLQPKTL